MYKYISFLILLCFFLFVECNSNSDKLEFAKTTMTELASGEYNVEDKIDWEIFYSNDLKCWFILFGNAK